MRSALKSGVKKETLKQTKGTGASGSFKMADAKTPNVVMPKKVTKPKVAKKPKADGLLRHSCVFCRLSVVERKWFNVMIIICVISCKLSLT